MNKILEILNEYSKYYEEYKQIRFETLSQLDSYRTIICKFNDSTGENYKTIDEEIEFIKRLTHSVNLSISSITDDWESHINWHYNTCLEELVIRKL